MGQRLKEVCKGFREAVERAVSENLKRGRGGQHVSFHGDFCSANPSTLARLERWAKEMERAELEDNER